MYAIYHDIASILVQASAAIDFSPNQLQYCRPNYVSAEKADLMEVEDEVKFTDIAEIVVQNLHK